MEWMKKNYLICFMVVNVIFLAGAVINYISEVSDLKKLEFSQEQLQSYTNDASIGGSIDASHSGGLYDIIPDMFLEKGYYSYTVYYEGDSAESFCWPHTYVEFYDVLEQQTVSLGSGNTEGTRRFWLNVDLNVALRLYYSGEGNITFKGFTIEETSVLANMNLFSQVLFLIGVNIVILYAIREKQRPLEKKVKYSMVAMLVIVLIASSLSLSGSMYDGHDIRFHLARIEGIKEGLLSGQFPVRISPVFYNGYGYANSIFYGEIFLYFPALLRMIGFSVADSYNAFLIALNILTVLLCFYCGKKIFSDEVIAVAIAFLYTLSPYRLMDTYIRAAIGEVTAMAFLPLVAYGLYRILTEDTSLVQYKRAYLPLTLGITGIIQSHVLTVEMAGGVILMACVFFCFKTLEKKRFIMLVKTVAMTLLVNAWFLVPFVDFMMTQDIRVFAVESKDLIQKTGLFLPQLFSLFSDYSTESIDAGNGLTGEMTYSMGLALGLGILLLVAMLGDKKEESKLMRRRGLCFLILSLIVLWMVTVYFPWDRISTSIAPAAPFVSSIQFVWRFVGIASVLAAFTTGFGLFLLKKQEGKTVFWVAASALIVLSVVSAMDFVQDNAFGRGEMSFHENTFEKENNSYYAMNGEYALCKIQYDVVTQIFEPRSYDGVQITGYEKAGTNTVFSVDNDTSDGYVLLPILNYKGYSVSSEDGVITNANLQEGESAVVRVNIPGNYSGTIWVSYKGMWYWRIAELVSLITVLYLIWYYRGGKQIKKIQETGK